SGSSSASIRRARPQNWIASRLSVMNKERSKGLVYENFVIALDVLRAHKLRSGLIILGVAIGVASLMGMVSILLGLGDMITRQISSSEETVIGVVKCD